MMRVFILALTCVLFCGIATVQPALALTAGAKSTDSRGVMLSAEQSRHFRAWMVRIMQEQIRQGPSPRWVQHDCVSLVRYAVAESLRPHDAKWMRANGLSARQLPAEITLEGAQNSLRHTWERIDGSAGAYVSAIGMIQKNSRYIAKDFNQAQSGDLLFFDQGDEQHLMVWLDGLVIYHTGTVTATDNGLRLVPVSQLLRWKDTRWRPTQDNPNFAGIYRLAFLPH